MTNRTKYLATLAAAVGALALPLLAGGDSAAGGASKDHVTGSVRYAPANAQAWVSAHSDADGANAYGRFRLVQGSQEWRCRVTCLSVNGNRAIVGGEVLRRDGSVSGGFYQFIEDNGSPGTTDRSVTRFLSQPPTDCNVTFVNGLQVTGGNYVVQDN